MGGVLLSVPLAIVSAPEIGQIAWIPPADLGRLLSISENLFGVALLSGAVLLLGCMGVSVSKPAIVPTAWALVPPLVLFGASQFTPLWLIRYLMFTVAAWALLAALVLARVTVVRATAVLLLLLLVALPTQVDIRRSDGHSQASAALAAVITANMRDGDGVVYATNDRGGSWIGRDTVAHYVPVDRRPRDLLTIRPQRVNGYLKPAECAAVASCLDDAPRLWVVRTLNTNEPLADLGIEKEKALSGEYTVDKVWQFKGMTLALLVRKSSAES
jgi:mannosyltransferase